MTQGRICIVTPSHISANPRVVKEADALHGAGFDVRVVFGQKGSEQAREHDRAVLEGKAWSWTAVRSPRRAYELFSWLREVLLERLLRLLPPIVWPWSLVAERAEGRLFAGLTRHASAFSADLYIGHYPEGLAAAARAAKQRESKFGYDAEDFHTGEPNPPDQLKRVDFIERRYVGRCSFLSAASDGIAKALAARYGIEPPMTVHNVFPWMERNQLDRKSEDRVNESLSLYWYSQTIGLDRGIEDAVRAAGELGGPVQIHLRGAIDPFVRESLETLARECGLKDMLFFHAPVPPTELLSRAAEHDVGLALEQGHILNRAICTTNKLFFYLLAGLAVAATDVPGQRDVLSSCATAAALYPPGDYKALARALESWRVDHVALKRAKSAALEAARVKWNWEIESQGLITRIRESLQARRPDWRTAHRIQQVGNA
jgi:glycosyltransferase involved in cell wall biosynthesis